MWTKESLHEFIREKMGDYLFIVVSNREPYVHLYKKGKIEYIRGAGGVVTALDPVMQACRGLWVVNGSGEADRKVTDGQGKIAVPPDNPSYTLKRIWLTKEEENGYYYGYSNEAIWPLCHMAFQRPVFRSEDWEYYQQVNKKFAKAIMDEVGDKKAFIWIQDYHFCLLPKYLKEMAPNQLIIAHFWHIPWPGYEAFSICPQRKEILDGLLANDLLGFHIRCHCDNFFSAVDREIESKIDRERFSVVRGGHETIIRPYPISVDFQGISSVVESQKVAQAMDALKEEFQLSGCRLLLGIDRIDYTKGIPERMAGIDRLLEKHPEYKEKIVFLQVGEISRLHIPRYKALNDEINALVEQINWKHSTGMWKPIIMIRRHMSFSELLALNRLCDVAVVSSLHDGMNLVAKEFVSSRVDNQGVLVLSEFTGASRELTDAILINPFDRDQVAEGLFTALELSAEDAQKRMVKMRNIVELNNIFRWAGKAISELLKFEFKE
ncbi:MAG TPA: trehalose-6-phosphate synthase [Candidatus Omnitrophica bacterium]|nr:trehalose-6-phosphate synthase [Candidatus Omnitrophota bacterium]